VQTIARKPSISPKPLLLFKDKFAVRDEVVWDDEERDYVMSLDMTDRVMGYQSFQGASTPANLSSNV